MSKQARKPQSFASMLEQTSYFTHACKAAGCSENASVGQQYCDAHRCEWHDDEGARCGDIATSGCRCEAHALVILPPVEPIEVATVGGAAAEAEFSGFQLEELSGVQPVVVPEVAASGITARAEGGQVVSSPVEEPLIDNTLQHPKIQPGRRVRKTWELPTTGLDDLTRFSKELQDNIGVRISEAHHISIAIQVYSEILKASPTLLTRIDQAISGTETVVQAQDIVTRTVRQYVVEMLTPKA